MKKAVFKDKEDFHAWQAKTGRGLDDVGQQSLSVMCFPVEYPCILVWDIREEYDIDAPCPNQPRDTLYYKYLYLGDFPVKRIKRGTYVYQVFQTGDCADC